MPDGNDLDVIDKLADCHLPACFIIAPIGTNLEPLTRVVRNAGWRVLNLESVEPGAPAYLDTTTQLIRAANAVIVVLTEDDSPNTLVETGLAIGLGRPVLLIADDAAIMDGLIPDRMLAGLPRVRAKLGDSDAIKFHVTAYLDGVGQSPRPDASDTTSRRTMSDRLKTRTTRPVQPGSQLEARLLHAFEGAPEIEAVHLEPQLAGSHRFRPDFALWLRDTRQVMPNPLIIELVGNMAVQRGSSQKRLKQLQKYAYDTGVGAVMLVEDIVAQPLTLLRLSPMTFRVGLEELEALLSDQRLVSEMLRARNFLAHSAG